MPVHGSPDAMEGVDRPDLAAIEIFRFARAIGERHVFLFRNQMEQLACYARKHAP